MSKDSPWKLKENEDLMHAEGDKAVGLICKTCGSDKFFVASGEYVTMIQCPICLWTDVVHSG